MLPPEKAKLVTDNMALVYGVINSKLLRRYDDAPEYEDIVQEGMYALCRAAMTYDPSRSRFSTYAYRVILNRLCVFLNEHSRQVRGIDAACAGEPGGRLNPSVNPDLTDGVVCRRITELAKTAPRGMRTNLRMLLMSVSGYTTTEIAYEYGISANQVRTQIWRARKYLRDMALSA